MAAMEECWDLLLLVNAYGTHTPCFWILPTEFRWRSRVTRDRVILAQTLVVWCGSSLISACNWSSSNQTCQPERGDCEFETPLLDAVKLFMRHSDGIVSVNSKTNTTSIFGSFVTLIKSKLRWCPTFLSTWYYMSKGCVFCNKISIT